MHFLEPNTGMLNYVSDLKVHRTLTQKILEESKSPSISAVGRSLLLQAIMTPSMSSDVPSAQAGDWSRLGGCWMTLP